MKKLNPSLLLAAAITLCANSALAQGTMLYTWHGAQGLFQASFQIYDWEQAPGTWFSGTHLYEQTFTITSPNHTWPAGTGGGYASGFRGPGNSLFLDVIFSDPAFPGPLYVWADGIDQVAGDTPFHEIGFWTSAPVPEPSFAAFLILGLAAFLSREGHRQATDGP